jgi:hypothetical protein
MSLCVGDRFVCRSEWNFSTCIRPLKKGDEKGGAGNVRSEMLIKFYLENLKGRDNLESPDVSGRILLKLIFRK